MSVIREGSIAANGESVVVPLDTAAMATVTVSGVWSGQLRFQISNDNVTWETIHFASPSAGFRLNALPFNGVFCSLTAGFRFFRVVADAWTLGTANLFIYAVDTIYPYGENHHIRILDGTVRSSSGADSNSLHNLFYRNSAIYVNVTSVTNGPVDAPTIRIYSVIFDAEYLVAEFVGVGTMDTNENRRYMIGPATWGGLWDDTAGFTLTRENRVEVEWSLTGGQSVTYDLDIAQTL